MAPAHVFRGESTGASFGPPTSAPAAIAHVSHTQVMTRGMTARATDPRGCASAWGPCRIATRNASSAEAYSGPNDVTASAVRGWRSARGPERHPLTALAVTSFGPLYASALLAFLVAIRHGPHADAHPRGSVALAVMPLVITWACDTCAMAAGALVGGPKLAPVLSPRKTWAGAIGGVVGGLLAALAYGPLVLERVALRLELWQLVTVVVAVAAQVGDIAESLFKREVGVKDSSSLIPGHGGVLDRLDSVYFVAPVAAALLRWFGLA